MPVKRNFLDSIRSANRRFTDVLMRQPLSRRAFAFMTGCMIAAMGLILVWQLNQTIGMAQGNAAWMDWSRGQDSAMHSTSLAVRTLSAGGPLLADDTGSVSVAAVSALTNELRGGWESLIHPPGASLELVSTTQQVIRSVDTLADRLNDISSAAGSGQQASALKMLEQIRQAPSLGQLHDGLQILSGIGRRDWRLYQQDQRDRQVRAVWIELTVVEALIALVVVLGLGLYWPVPGQETRPQVRRYGRRRDDRAPDRLLDMVGHDLRQPLQAMGSFVSVLERHAARPEFAQTIEGMRSATESMDRMISGLLDMSRLDAGRIVPEFAEFDIADVLDPIRREFSCLAAEKHLDFRISLISAPVRTDPVLIESILRNLVVNAIKYTSAGHVELRVSASGPELTIEVEDTGPGISAAELSRIFDDFYRCKETQRTADGLGLGLAVARRMAALLESAIRVRSTPGHGSIFSIDLPRVESSPAAPATEAAPFVAPRKAEEALRGLRVLVVDDDTHVGQALHADLEPFGARVTTASGPEEACSLVALPARQAFDLVLVDLDLGVQMTGADLLDHLASEHGVAVPALVMTGSTDHQLLHELRRADYPYVRKPVSLPELAGWIVRLRGLAEAEMVEGVG